jgi:hypothetical protein
VIIQKVIKGVTGAIGDMEALRILTTGIFCKWWQRVNNLPEDEIQPRLTEENLRWHQNRYDAPDPRDGGRPFCESTPFISTTAGSVIPDVLGRTNVAYLPWWTALYFATECLARDDGYLYYCYVFILGRKSISHRGFSEELRELNLYTNYSPFHPEGEITAKIIIPSIQIERVEHWSLKKILTDLSQGREPGPVNRPIRNPLYVRPEEISNIRGYLFDEN